MPVVREDYERVYSFPDGSIQRSMRFYEFGVSPEWLLEHLLRRELLYKNMTQKPDDPRISRDVKDTLIRKEG